MRTTYVYITLFFLITSIHVWGQDSVKRKIPVITTKSPVITTKEAVKQLSNSLETNKPDAEIANDYATLAREFFNQGDYVKAENNWHQAIQLYSKSKNKEQRAEAYRELARTQEMLGKYSEAITHYNRAAKESSQKAFKALNQNDASRLANRSNPQQQSKYIQQNIDISKTVRNKEEVVVAHQQMAQVKLDMDDKKGAVAELKNALDNVEDNPDEVLKIKQEMVKTYVADEQYEKAISLNQSLVTETQKANNPKAEIGQLKNLAHTYFEAKEERKGVQALQQAYDLAIAQNQTMEARHTLQELIDYYKETNNSTAALNAYTDFFARLDTLIQSDSTLIDAKFFQLHEERIKRLENERALKDKLIRSTNRFNYILLGAIVLILIFLGFIAKALFSINRKNKKIALQSLRREMNPHFIFNSLNSVNQFIAQNNELEANKYLSSYSRLMRNIMENSNNDFIPLSTEVEQLKEYLELEHMRFRDKFTYNIEVDESLDGDHTYIPNMIIQPQLENAIWHGLRYKESDGRLLLRITKSGETVQVMIEDNGIGLKRSEELKTKHQKQHHSRGLNNTHERIHLLTELYRIPISLNITEKIGEAVSGVIVTLNFPLIDQKPGSE